MDLLNIDYEKYTLNNGLNVILYQKKNLPLVAVNIWYKVGSANEVKGKTGIAHLFEHMMFQGSKHVPKEKHFKFIQEAGGTLNASTSFDRTNYYEKLPSNYLELALWLESDRMGFFLPVLDKIKLENQREVVSNERLQRYDNQPYGLAWETIITNLFPQNHPYSWPTIGFMEDIKSYSLYDVSNFFKSYYSPSNACMVIAGNFETDKAKELIELYFSEIKRTDTKQTQSFKNFKLKENIFIHKKEKVQLERIYLVWPTNKIFSKDDAQIDVLGDILAGSKTARLNEQLVHKLEIAQDIQAFQISGNFGGAFLISATVKPNINPEKVKSEIFKSINKLIDKGSTEKELLKSKNGIKSQFIYSLQNLDTMADQLNNYNFYLNEPNYFSFDLNRYSSVTEKGLLNVAEKYLLNNHLELRISPEQ